MKIYFFFYSFISFLCINIFLMIGSIYLSIFGINYSLEYSKIEVRNNLNFFVEKNRYILNYKNNEEYLDLLWEDLYFEIISNIENGLKYNENSSWKNYLDTLNLSYLKNNSNLYELFFKFLYIPINFLQYFDPEILNSNDFAFIYKSKAFIKVKIYSYEKSIFHNDYWYNSNSKLNYYKFLSDTIYLFLELIEQIMLKQINEENVNILNESITISDVIDVQDRKLSLNSYDFYKIEFNKYILHSYINIIFMIIILPITTSINILLFLLLKLFNNNSAIGLNLKINHLFLFKYY